MHILQETHCYRVSWHDEAHSILIFDVIDQWTWTDANVGIRYLNDVLAATPHDVYTVYVFNPRVSIVPAGGGALTNLKNLISLDSSNEQLVLIVNVQSLLRSLTELAGKLAGGKHGGFAKFRFVSTFEQALNLIADHKQQKTMVIVSSQD